jgi:RNA polymerase sigma-70 factor (ECF subfamily)
VPVYRWLLRSVGDASLAEDLTSDVFVDVWCHAGSFEGGSTVATWLLAIARYKALSALRRHADHELDEKSAAEIPDSADDPELGPQCTYTGCAGLPCQAQVLQSLIPNQVVDTSLPSKA